MGQTQNNSENEPIAVGIDLGTTYSVVAQVDEFGQPTIIPNTDNERTTPSAVYIDGTQVVVGQVAKDQTQITLDHTIQFIKPFMGRQRKRFRIADQDWTPEELSALILRKVVRDAETALGGSKRITHAVITVPAFFTEQQRKSTEDAGCIAGLEVLGIINEPTAAALSYGYDKLGTDKTVVVYDLGGGTFDVTVMRIEGDTVTMLATDGDVQLGGKDWDQRLIDYVSEIYLQRHGVDPRDNPHSLAVLYSQAEQAKLRLSKLPATKIAVTVEGHTDSIEVTRDQFDEMTEDLLAQTETTLQLTLEEAGLTLANIDECLLVGGSTRMRSVRDMLKRVLGAEPRHALNPDECVAMGAAIHAVMLQLRINGDGARVPKPKIQPDQLDRFRQMREQLINPHTLGILALGEDRRQVVVPLIARRATIPCASVKTFRTSSQDQTQIRIVVMEGESRQPEACTELGTCVVRGLPPGLAKGTPVEVRFAYSLDGTLDIAARLPTIQQEIQAQISRSMGMTEEAIKDARTRLGMLEIS